MFKKLQKYFWHIYNFYKSIFFETFAICFLRDYWIYNLHIISYEDEINRSYERYNSLKILYSRKDYANFHFLFIFNCILLKLFIDIYLLIEKKLLNKQSEIKGHKIKNCYFLQSSYFAEDSVCVLSLSYFVGVIQKLCLNLVKT